MKKSKIILESILLAILMVLFPVLSGILVGILSSITNKDFNQIGLYIQGTFILLSVIIAFIYIKKKKINYNELGFTFNKNKSLFFYIPCIIIFIPTLFNGFIWKNAFYFFGCLFLYSMVGISEELYFRGIIPIILKKHFNAYYVIIISTIIFGFGHATIIFNGVGINTILLTIINALIFGFLAIELKILTKNITILMIIHFFFDFESKFILVNDSLIMYEIIRGVIMTIYAVVLMFIIVKRKTQNSKYSN